MNQNEQKFTLCSFLNFVGSLFVGCFTFGQRAFYPNDFCSNYFLSDDFSSDDFLSDDFWVNELVTCLSLSIFGVVDKYVCLEKEIFFLS